MKIPEHAKDLASSMTVHVQRNLTVDNIEYRQNSNLLLIGTE